MERMGAGDLNQYRRLRPGTPDGEIRRRLGAGEICFLARLDREPIACRWYSLGRAEMPYLGFAFELPDNLAYVRDAFTAPWARGCGLATLLRAYGETLLRDLGARSFITTVLPENVAGLRLTASGGFTPVGRIAALRLPGRRVVLRDPDLEHLGPARPLPVPWSIPAP
jgi:hypothetical protein